MDPFEEFARAVASGEPEKFTIPETDPAKKKKCEKCGEEVTFLYHGHPIYDNICEKCYKEFLDDKDIDMKRRKEEFEEYEKAYVRRLELAKEEVEKARAEMALTDDPKQKKKQRGVGVNRTDPRKVSDIHILTREEVEKAREEIEIIKIMEPNRKSQKTIPTQATILNSGTALDDCYVIFGIDQFITCDELKDQFRKLSVKYNSSIGMLSRTKEENEIMGKVHTKINQAYPELNKAHKCGG